MGGKGGLDGGVGGVGGTGGCGGENGGSGDVGGLGGGAGGGLSTTGLEFRAATKIAVEIAEPTADTRSTPSDAARCPFGKSEADDFIVQLFSSIPYSHAEMVVLGPPALVGGGRRVLGRADACATMPY